MNSSPSASEINPFFLLDLRIQHWIWSRGWSELRAVQELAIPALLAGDHDVILAAATSAGKTEAAFFPILTQLLKPNGEGRTDGGFVLSISPLKALINDQEQRLQDVCWHLDLPVLGWHGDVPASRKQRFLQDPSGVLIITPESLEALFVTRGTAIPRLAALIKYIVIDELHSFLGTERGKQLQSLMARIELAAQRTIPRVGLSATLRTSGSASRRRINLSTNQKTRCRRSWRSSNGNLSPPRRLPLWAPSSSGRRAVGPPRWLQNAGRAKL